MTQLAILILGGLVSVLLLFISNVRLRTREGCCAHCGYDNRHARSELCPECGSNLKDVQHKKSRLQRTARICAAITAVMTPVLMWCESRGWSPPLPTYRYEATVKLPTGATIDVFSSRHSRAAPRRYVLRGADGSKAEGATATFWYQGGAAVMPDHVGVDFTMALRGPLLAVVLGHDSEEASGPDSADIVTIDRQGAIHQLAKNCSDHVLFSMEGKPPVPTISVSDRGFQALSGKSFGYMCASIFVWDGTTFQFDAELSTAEMGWRPVDIQEEIPFLRLYEDSGQGDIESLMSVVSCLLLVGQFDTAWRVFDEAWPDSIPGKKEHRAKLEHALSNSWLAKFVKEQSDTAPDGNP